MEKELIKRALLGDKQAQKECTEKGIVLPCPICGEQDNIDVGFYTGTLKGFDYVQCDNCGFGINEFHLDNKSCLKMWNTRQPIQQLVTFCKDCVYGESEGYLCSNPYIQRTVQTPYDFCSLGKPKEVK